MRITLKRAYADGTVAVDMDPLSLLCRLATSVPPPRCHTVSAEPIALERTGRYVHARSSEASHGICIACASVLMQEIEVATRKEPV